MHPTCSELAHAQGTATGSTLLQRACTQCQGGTEHCTVREQLVPYGDGGAYAELRTRVRVWECSLCQDPYTEADAEDSRSKAVRCHLESLS
jgi:hypothetical protein